MVFYSSPVASFVFFYLPSSTPSCSSSSSIKLPRAKITPFCCADLRYDNSSPARVNPESPKRSNGEQLAPDSSCFSLSCSCTRRRFAEAAAATALFPICPSNASNLHSDYTVQHNLVICFQNVMLPIRVKGNVCHTQLQTCRSELKIIMCHLGFKGDNLYA